MAKLRKLWSTTRGPESSSIQEMYRKRHESRAAAYRQVREEWRRGFAETDYVNVWVDERDGHGWQHFEQVNLTDYGVDRPEGTGDAR